MRYTSAKAIYGHIIYSAELYNYQPATVFLYSPHSFRVKQTGIRRTSFEGYTPKTAFYHPDYSLMDPVPDYRRTLYWNPNVTTGKDGTGRISFYNNSSCRQLVISAEGITQEGKAVFYKP